MRLVHSRGGSSRLRRDFRHRTSIESLERRVLLAATLDLVTGAGALKSITYPTAGGTTATISVAGGGSATVHFAGDTISQSTKNNAVTLSGTNIIVSGIDGAQTTTNTTLKVTTKNNVGTVALGRITSNGSFGTIQGNAVVLTNGVVTTGAVNNLKVQRITGGPITLGAGNKTAIQVANNSSFNLTAAGVKSISVGGDLTNSTFTLLGATQGGATDLGTLSVKGAINGLTINSHGSLGNLSATSLSGSTIFSGVGPLGITQTIPASAADFTSANKIASLKLKKASGTVSFANTEVAAQTLGTLNLGGVLVSNAGVPFGLAATKYNSLNFVAGASGKTLTLNNITSQTQVSNAVSKAGVNLQDFVVKVVT